MSDRQVFIGNLCNISNEVLRTYCESYGPLTELSLNRDKENNVYHCFAFVTFQLPRSTSQFMSNRPHLINGDEVFVKRALPRSTSTIPERLIVTNRLILQDLHQHDKRVLQNYFQKFGLIKKIDTEHGFIDYDDYDDVDRVLLARPHYIRDKEISVTKFVPTNHNHDNSDHHHIRYHHRHSNNIEQPDRIITTSTETMKLSCIKKSEQNSSDIAFIDQQCDDEESDDGEIDCNHLNTRYEYLQQQYEEYKQSKEIEICALRMDLERTKRQLTDLTQEKLDRLLQNQQLYHNELILRLSPHETLIHTQTAEDLFRSTPDKSTKKRKLTSSSSIDREYEYYS